MPVGKQAAPARIHTYPFKKMLQKEGNESTGNSLSLRSLTFFYVGLLFNNRVPTPQKTRRFYITKKKQTPLLKKTHFENDTKVHCACKIKY
jgi:hypothetical protein